FTEGGTIIGQPIVVNGDVVIVTSGLLDARSVVDGSQHYSISSSGGGYATGAAFGGNHVIVGLNGPIGINGGGLQAHDLTSVLNDWSVSFPAGENPGTPTIVRHRVG